MIWSALGTTAGCASDPADATDDVCHFPSGRPCAPGTACLGVQGDECNYYACVDGALVGSAVACTPATVAPTTDGPYDCDPTSVPVTTSLTPPPAPCPIGGLYAIDAGGWRACVPVAECAPLPCDPSYGGDGCPSNYTCAPATSTCVPVTR